MKLNRLLSSSLAAALTLLIATGADADGGLTPLSSLDDQEIDQRLEFLETSLASQATPGAWWQWGWTTAYASGIVLGTANLIAEDDNEDRVNDIVTAVKGVIGTTRYLLAPLPARLGASELDGMPTATREQKMARLAEAEKLLQRNAHKAESRWDWRRHFFNAALNLVGGAFILGFGNDTDALVSVLLGTTVGEISIFTIPQGPVADLRAYEQQFSPAQARAERNWRIVATPQGAQFQLTF